MSASQTFGRVGIPWLSLKRSLRHEACALLKSATEKHRLTSSEVKSGGGGSIGATKKGMQLWLLPSLQLSLPPIAFLTLDFTEWALTRCERARGCVGDSSAERWAQLRAARRRAPGGLRSVEHGSMSNAKAKSARQAGQGSLYEQRKFELRSYERMGLRKSQSSHSSRSLPLCATRI